MSQSTASSSGTDASTSIPPFNDINYNTVDNSSYLIESIRQLQQNLQEINRPWLEKMQQSEARRSDICKGKNKTRQSNKMNMSGTDVMNKGIISAYLREIVWPAVKILPEKWTTWIEDERALSYKVMQKVSVPMEMDSQQYWQYMMADITNEMFCALRSNLKQGCYGQYEGDIICCNCVFFIY